MHRLTILTLFLLALAAPAAAQFVDEEENRDHAEQDRRYLERLKKPAPGDSPDATPRDDATVAAAYVARAEELIRDRNYRGGRSKHYRIQTDDPRIDTSAVGDLLERFRTFFDSFWSERTNNLLPYEEPSRVFLFYSFYKYNQLLGGDWRFSRFRPAGHYRSAVDALTIHTDSGPDDGAGLAETLLHESAHQLLFHRLFNVEHELSPWLSEGLATYFGYTDYEPKSGFRPGRIGDKSFTLYRGKKRVERGRGARLALRALDQALRDPDGSDAGLFSRTASLDAAAAFYAEAPLSYATSWVLVHYLLHADEGAHAGSLIDYIGLEATGNGSFDQLLGKLEMSAAELDAAVSTYARTLKSR